MSKPTEHKTVQARILAYAQEIGWTLVSRTEAERRRGFDADAATAEEERARRASLYFGELTRYSHPSGSLRLSIFAALRLLHGQLRVFNPLYQEAEDAGIGQWQRLPSSIAGNRDFLTILRNQSKFLISLFKKPNAVSLMIAPAPFPGVSIWPQAVAKTQAMPSLKLVRCSRNSLTACERIAGMTVPQFFSKLLKNCRWPLPPAVKLAQVVREFGDSLSPNSATGRCRIEPTPGLR